jgi:hypothetical protein
MSARPSHRVVNCGEDFVKVKFEKYVAFSHLSMVMDLAWKKIHYWLFSFSGTINLQCQAQPARFENIRGLSSDFALAVTEQTAVADSWIARNGNVSLFRTLQRIVPQVIL